MKPDVLLKLFFLLISIESSSQTILKSSDADTILYPGKEMQYKVSHWKKGCGIVWQAENGRITGPTNDSTVVVVWDNVKDIAKIEARQTECSYKSISLSEQIVADKPQGKNKKPYRLKEINVGEKSTHSTSQKHRRWFVNSLEIFGGPNVSYNYGNWRLRNYSDLRGVSNTRYLKWGWAAGVGFSIPIYKKLEMNVRLEYEQTGADNRMILPRDYYQEVIRHISYRRHYTYHFLKNSLVLHYPIYASKVLEINAGIGGYIARIKHYTLKRWAQVTGRDENYNLWLNTRINDTVAPDGQNISVDFTTGLEAISKYDFGTIADILFKLKISHNQIIGFQLLQTIGLKDLNYPLRVDSSLQGEIHGVTKEYRLYTSFYISYLYHLNN